jgi:hypothetical protein
MRKDTVAARRATVALTMAVALGGTAASPTAAQQVVTLPAKDAPLPEKAAPVYTVGTEEGASWEMFSGIRGLAFDGSDNLYILDSQNQRIVVLDARGRFVRQFGKRGGGPGELQLPLGIATLADGSIVVSDVGNRAFIVYNSQGEHVRNIPYPDEVGLPMNVMPDLRGEGLFARANQRLAEPGQTGSTSILRVALDGRTAPATLFTQSTAAAQQIDGGQNRRIVVSMDPVFGPRTNFAPLADGGVAVQHESTYSVRILDRAGRHQRTIARAYPQRKVTKKDQDAWRERQREAQASGRGVQTIVLNSTAPNGAATSGGAPAGGRSMPNINFEPTFADVMSVVTNLRSDPAGRIWIQHRNQDGSDAGPIDLVDANGRYIGTLPAQQLPGAISRSGLAAWIVRDDLGVERVAVRRLPQSWQ